MIPTFETNTSDHNWIEILLQYNHMGIHHSVAYDCNTNYLSLFDPDVFDTQLINMIQVEEGSRPDYGLVLYAILFLTYCPNSEYTITKKPFN